MKPTPILLLTLLLAAPTFADTIQLKDGRTLTGTLHRDTDRGANSYTIKTESGESISTPADDILRITLTGNITPAQAAESEWTRTAALIRKANDLAVIIELHQKFLEKFPDQSLSSAVRNSMEEYEKLDRQKAVKFRGRWMPAAQVEVTLRLWDEQARPAITFYNAGRIREAYEAAAPIAAVEDAGGQNPTVLTIAGLAAYRLNNLNTAREYFKKLALADPSTPLPENNLAVIAAQQKVPTESLLHYLKALQAAPDNRLLLDNIEEVFANYAGDKNASTYTDLLRLFDLAETRMEADLAKQNLFRWGSTWVNRDQFDHLAAYRHGVQDAMIRLDKQYNAARQAVIAITDQITQANHDYNSALDSVNNLNTVIADQQYYTDVYDSVSRRDRLMAELAAIRARKLALENQRDQIIFSFSDVFAQADKLKAALAFSDASLYPGIQRIMQLGEDRNPPPPLPIAIPKIPGFTPPPPLVHASPAAPITPDQRTQQKITETYHQLSTPIGLPMPKQNP